jgi:4-hydroxybenzoate polyprenyltransferase
MRIRPYLALVRVHLTPTAVADSFTGYCLAVAVRGRPPSQLGILGIAAASTLIYWMGMATNDLLDLEKDRASQPHRPLPRGEASRSSVLALSALLAAGGLLAAFLTDAGAGVMASTLLGLALLYNGGAKRIPIIGNLIMGSCRSVNLLMGAAAAIPVRQLTGERLILLSAAILGIYMAWVTAVSLLEDRPPRVASFLGSTLPILLLPAAVAAISPVPGPLPYLNSIALTLLLGAAIYRGLGMIPGKTAVDSRQSTVTEGRTDRPESSSEPRAPSPKPQAFSISGDVSGTTAGARPPIHPAEGFVRDALLGIFLVDAGFLLAADRPRLAAALWGLMILAWLWRRRWLQSSA